MERKFRAVQLKIKKKMSRGVISEVPLYISVKEIQDNTCICGTKVKEIKRLKQQEMEEDVVVFQA